MYLSRAKLDLSRGTTKKAISSPQIIHGIIENCFEEKNRTIWRLDSLNGNLYLLLVSEIAPCFEGLISQLCEDNESGQTKNYDAFLESIEKGQKFHFRFRGNPIHSVVIEKGKRGKVTPHVGEQYKKEWFIKKSNQNGFSMENDYFAIVETGTQQFYKKGKNAPIKLSYTIFEGVLTVTNVELFVKALTQGVGRAKAYGCGLITVMRLK
jgi:CRISPR system Cascade subunit CasE